MSKPIDTCLEYCREQNGISTCKNCGLTQEMIDEVARKAREEERERLLKIVRQTLVLEPEQVNDGFILGFSNCRQRIEEALTTPLKDPN